MVQTGVIDDAAGSRLTRAGVALTLAGSVAGATAYAARTLLQRQAAQARRAIGKPLGEQAPLADRHYRKKLGQPVDLLVLGDSIAAGLGAERAKHTLGGRLARGIARSAGRSVRLRTAAVVGSESSMLADQLATLPDSYRPDVAVIVVGGNDVTHRVRVSESRRHLGEAVGTLRERGIPVVVGTCPDLGALPVLQQPLRALAGVSSRQLAAAQRDVVTELGGLAVSLADVVGPFFVTRPDEMFAVDRFHPSGAGYRRTAKAVLPSVLVALSLAEELPHGHHGPLSPGGAPARRGAARPAAPDAATW